MRDDFEKAIRGVWTRLGLGEPRVDDPRHFRMRIEGVGIDLLDSGTGLVLIEGIAGRFSADRAIRARQVRKVIESNLGLLLDSHASVFERRPPGGDPVLVARSSYALASADLDLLIGRIEDTLRTIEYYAPEFQRTSSATPPTRRQAAPSFDNEIIFRP